MEVENSPLKTAPKIFKETCEINWNLTVKQVYDFVRGLSPVPGAWTIVKTVDGKENVLKIYRATKTDIPSTSPIGEMVIDRKHLYFACSDYLLQIDELQMAGKKRMDAQSFINGLRKQ